jgi:hypothetical protein
MSSLPSSPVKSSVNDFIWTHSIIKPLSITTALITRPMVICKKTLKMIKKEINIWISYLSLESQYISKLGLSTLASVARRDNDVFPNCGIRTPRGRPTRKPVKGRQKLQAMSESLLVILGNLDWIATFIIFLLHLK